MYLFLDWPLRTSRANSYMLRCENLEISAALSISICEKAVRHHRPISVFLQDKVERKRSTNRGNGSQQMSIEPNQLQRH
jgi:hypothetical protein